MNASAEAWLIGWIGLPLDQPGFVIPLFRRAGANAVLAQCIDHEDRIVGFREDECHADVEYRGVPITREAGEIALWGYAFPGERAMIDHRHALAEWLAARIDEIADPLLRLQAIEFCEVGPQMRKAWRAAYDGLAEHAPRSARAWRDLVVVPTRVRQAIMGVVRDHRLDLSVHALGRDVAVRIVDGQVRLALDPLLHAGLTATPGAIPDLVDATQEVRAAFALGNELAIEPQPGEPPMQVGPVDTIPDVVIACGPRAVEVVRAAMAPEERTLWVRPWADDQRQAKDLLVVALGGQIVYRGSASDLDRLDAVLPDLERWGVSSATFVFGMTWRDAAALEQACRLAQTLDRKRVSLVAAIPHLPGAAAEKPFKAVMWQEHVQTLFDRICFVSDLSAYARGSLALGPARSSAAAGERMGILLRRLRRGGDAPLRRRWRKRNNRVEVIASVVDNNLRAPRLLEHALMRALDPYLDWRDSEQATVLLSGEIKDREFRVLPAILASEGIGKAEFSVKPAPLFRSPTGAFDLHLSGARWLPMDEMDFTSVCRDALYRLGWMIVPATAPYAAFRAIKGELELDIEPAALQAMPKGRARASLEDVVMVTEMTVRRARYIENMLAGVMPVHFSRLRMLESIHSRRYAYLIQELRKQTEAVERLLVRAAFRQFELGLADTISGTKVSRDMRHAGWSLGKTGAHVRVHTDAVRVDLEVRRLDRMEVQEIDRYRVVMVLTRKGWECADMATL